MIGKPDQLLKVCNSRSIFGNYRYRVVEVKTAVSLSRAHKIQASFYNRLLGLIQGVIPKSFTVVNGRKEESIERFSWGSSDDMYLEDARCILAGDYVPMPVHGRTPAPWRAFGNRLARHDITRLSQIGFSRREALFAARYFTIEEIARANESDLTKVPYMPRSIAGSVIASAQAVLAGKSVHKSPVQLPEVDVEIFLDMENENQDGFVNYLIGLIVRTSSAVQYISFFAETREEERKCWRSFCDFVMSVGPAAIYFWSASAEPVYIRKMVSKYDTPSEVIDKINNSLVDLHRRALDAVAFPVPSEGLKDISEHLGFEWRLPDYDGLWAMMQYNRYLQHGDAVLRDEILTYNEDDCRAAMHVKDWLAANSL